MGAGIRAARAAVEGPGDRVLRDVGTYGHEARNLATSKTIYAQSWASHVDGPEDEGEALATGYSCRNQVKRMSSKQVRHPLQALLDHMRAVG